MTGLPSSGRKGPRYRAAAFSSMLSNARASTQQRRESRETLPPRRRTAFSSPRILRSHCSHCERPLLQIPIGLGPQGIGQGSLSLLLPRPTEKMCQPCFLKSLVPLIDRKFLKRAGQAPPSRKNSESADVSYGIAPKYHVYHISLPKASDETKLSSAPVGVQVVGDVVV